MGTRESGHHPVAPAPEVELPEVLTVEEAARLLRVERKKIYELVAKDQLPGVRRLGRLIRISRTAVLSWFGAL